MRRAIIVMIFLFAFPLAFLPGDVSGGPCSNSLSPPFISTAVKPNILIILDNSNSMDEDFYGNAVGSYSPVSKSVVSRQALQSVVTTLQGKANVGVMTFNLPTSSYPNDVEAWYVHNSMPFSSYNPASYCPNPPPQCQTYCMSQDPTAQSVCEAACPGLTTTQYQHYYNGQLITTGFPDLIITYYSPTTDSTSTRARYCSLAYPKTQAWQNPTDPLGRYVYYNQTDPMYARSNLGTMFGYCGGDSPTGVDYSPVENANNTYEYCYDKNEQVAEDIWTGYSNCPATYTFQPTDTDYALGFYNWGQEMPWYYIGPTWFSQGNGPASPQGFLHVPVGDLTNTTQFNNVMNILNPNANNIAGYMSCTQSNLNNCPYIINAGNTPTAGTLLAALNYFNGTYAGQSSPINMSCQQNYIIFATDGLPSTDLGNNQTTNMSQLLSEVVSQLTNLQTKVQQTINGSTYTFPINTYFLGMGLLPAAKANLDQMAQAGGTATPDGHAYYADNPSEFYDSLQTIVANLFGRVTSGSAISILSEGQTQSGANMLQGVFYPDKYFGPTTLLWPGYLYGYWFYNSANFNNMREDTLHDYILELTEDDGITFSFSTTTGLSVSRFSDPTGSGNPNQPVDTFTQDALDSLTPLWEAGKLLFSTNASSRTVYTPGSSSSGLVSFNASNAALTSPASSPLGSPSTFDPCLQVSGTNPNWQTLTLQNLINYVLGTDLPSCRGRTVGLCSDGAGNFSNNACGSNSDCTAPTYSSCVNNVWKLGDIVYSSPQVQADYKYCYNGSSYNSQSCSQDSDCTSSPSYNVCQKKESVVFVGANDGMLHAFQTGTIITPTGVASSEHPVSQLSGIPTSAMGTELWAFIPKNSLPYLRCLAVPPPNSCHLYYSDLSPYVTTMVSNNVSKTVLIGGMRLGGGSIISGKYCFSSSGVSNGQVCSQNSDCATAPYNSSCSTTYYLNVPSDTCSASLTSATTLNTAASLCSNAATCYNPTNCTGLSSYYALDITDAENPKLLWEFSHPFLGYSYSGPAVIHKWSDPSTLSGDQYYVMFLSGPTNPLDGSSIQDVQAFVLNLNTNLGIDSVYYKDFGLRNGFGGRLFTNGLDVNGDGYTDFVLFGYANSPTGSSTGWQGGIGKINTNNTDFTAALSPQNWTYDVTTYSSSIAQLPITAQVAAMQCFNTWYLYAGTGRYFFSTDNYNGSANSGLNYLMGIPFTCDQYNNNCSSVTSLNNSSSSVCSSVQSRTFSQAGWIETLDAATSPYLYERMTTDPTISPTNIIYLTTSEPTSDPCDYGGHSRVWGLNCATGSYISDTSCSGFTVTNTNGTLYLQTSTGAVTQINAATSFANNSQTTIWYTGMPPENAPPLVMPNTPINKTGQLIQWMEK